MVILILLVETHTANFTAKPPCTDVGYNHTEVPSNWAFFTPQFKGVGKDLTLADIKPMLTNGVALSKNSTVQVQVFSDSAKGFYSLTYGWFPNLEGGAWSTSGTVNEGSSISLSAGHGFVINNRVRVNAAETAEASSGSRYRPIHLLHSGEVDLVPQTVLPCNWSFAGNPTFKPINLDQLVPTLTNGVALSKNSTVQIQIFNDTAKGFYSLVYGWFPNLEGGCWSTDGVTKHTDTIIFQPGQGYVVNNRVRVNAAETAEASSGSRYRPILMKIKDAE